MSTRLKGTLVTADVYEGTRPARTAASARTESCFSTTSWASCSWVSTPST